MLGKLREGLENQKSKTNYIHQSNLIKDNQY